LKKLLTIADDVLKPPKRHITVTDPKPSIGIIVPSLEKPICGIKEYTTQLISGIGDRVNTVLVSNSYMPDNREKLKNCSILNYQFEYSLYEKYFLERELSLIKDKLVSITLHSYSSGLWAENRMLADYSDQVIVHAKDMMERFSMVYKSKVITIPHGCDNPIKQHDKYEDGKFHIGTFGIVNPHKGLIELMLAVKELRDRKQLDVVLHMYSTVAVESNNSRLYAEHIEDVLKVHEMDFIEWHTEYLPRIEIIEELSKCDIIILPYFDTGQDYAISGAARTAMASLRPILLSDAFCFNDLQKVAYIIPQRLIASPYTFADTIQKISTADLFDVEKLQQYVNRNSWKNTGTKYINAWQGLINKNRRK
jgi:glycosyltransferase involved in cell wall biosynthesis